MDRLNDEAQWIVLMGFLVSFSFFFLALVINQSTVVGQTTAESVIEFPKNDIRDARDTIIDTLVYLPPGSTTNTTLQNLHGDLEKISLKRKNAVLQYGNPDNMNDVFYKCVPDENYYNCSRIIYNNGVTAYNETWISP